MGTRTSRNKAAGRCLSRCRPHSSTSTPRQFLTASEGPPLRPQDSLIPPATEDSLWVEAFAVFSTVGKSLGRGVKSCCPRRHSSPLRGWKTPLRPPFSSSSYPCWRSGRRRNECHAASLSQTAKKQRIRWSSCQEEEHP